MVEEELSKNIGMIGSGAFMMCIIGAAIPVVAPLCDFSDCRTASAKAGFSAIARFDWFLGTSKKPRPTMKIQSQGCADEMRRICRE